MRVELLHHSSVWLEGDFEPPEKLSREDHLVAWGVHHNAYSGLIAMNINGGTAVWDKSGKLLFYLEKGADLNWSRTSADLLSLETRFGSCQASEGIRHSLRQLEAGSFLELWEMEVCVPTGGVERLVLSHRGDKCLATWLNQTEWGYVMIDLQAKSQLPGGLYWEAPSLSPPDFSPNDAYVVSCHFFRDCWWNDEPDDPWDYPSPGGERKVGTITVHDIAADTMSHHDVVVELPAEWMPERPSEPDWSMIWGPEFISEQEFQIWLPDGSIEVLKLPLAEQVKITRILGIHRANSA